MCEQAQTGGLRERIAPSWQFEPLIWGISSGFPLANHLALPCSLVRIWFILGSSYVCTHLECTLSCILEKRPMGRLTSLAMRCRLLPFDLRGTFLSMCNQEGLLDLENQKDVVSYLGRAPLLLLFILEYLSTGDKLQLLSLGPIYLLLRLFLRNSRHRKIS